RGAGPLPQERLRLRTTAWTGPEVPLPRDDRQFEAFELVAETGMEPDSTGAVHRIRDDQQRPRKPLRHIRTRGHRDAGAGIDDDPTGPADRAQQPFELGFGNVG